ncbi:hypothetical protein B9Z55_026401 [Caenorhabditis nigoni]|uniref:Uncharacterized protein n=1 Tax=Caenorhabditis nigoni TaxID=1611254 RepID=A0A2G5T349_9PELO|nr:hypothetical protein B9Z55_026401 [Caenorhabditis nigoni]
MPGLDEQAGCAPSPGTAGPQIVPGNDIKPKATEQDGHQENQELLSSTLQEYQDLQDLLDNQNNKKVAELLQQDHEKTTDNQEGQELLSLTLQDSLNNPG